MGIRAVKYNYGRDVIEQLVKDKIVVTIKYGGGYVVARYGVNKTNLTKYAKKHF